MLDALPGELAGAWDAAHAACAQGLALDVQASENAAGLVRALHFAGVDVAEALTGGLTPVAPPALGDACASRRAVVVMGAGYQRAGWAHTEVVEVED